MQLGTGHTQLTSNFGCSSGAVQASVFQPLCYGTLVYCENVPNVPQNIVKFYLQG